jgi:hypothetical protein
VFLSAAELHDLTDRRQPSAQIKWLREHGWRFEVGASGRPKVDVAEKDRHMVGTRAAKQPAEPNLGALRRFG